MKRAQLLPASVATALAALLFLLASCAAAPEAPAPSGFPGGSWLLVELGGKAVADSVGDKIPTLAFREDGAAGGSSGCNQYGTKWTLSGEDGIAFAELWSTKMFCVDVLIEVEYYEMFRKTRAWRVEGGRLVLSDGSGTPLAVFERSE
ncbi:MAG: META domain-containing protein [Spirochaetales bacterium]|nr:META domain-containing protein [Spirochaetales bacterium]